MRKLLLLLFIVVLGGCSSDQNTAPDAATIEGYVTATEGGRYLIVSNAPIHLNDGNPQFVDALWVSTEEHVEVGDYVKVWATNILTSYPGQTSADKLEIISQNVTSNLSINEVD